MKHVIVGLENPADARPLIDWVERFALDVPSAVTVVHVEPRVGLIVAASVQADTSKYLRELRRSFRRDVMARLQQHDIPAGFELRRGEPAHELAEAARKAHADFIVIGGARHTALHDVVFGGFERRLEHRVDVPIVVVPLRHEARRVHTVKTLQRT
jgi:nucleotide-binding universal stress UspA family protein